MSQGRAFLPVLRPWSVIAPYRINYYRIVANWPFIPSVSRLRRAGGGEVSVVRRPWSKANVYRSQNSRYMSASGLLLIVPSIATLKSGSTWAVKVTPAENNVGTSMFVYTGEGDADSPSKQNNPVAQRDDRREASFFDGCACIRLFQVQKQRRLRSYFGKMCLLMLLSLDNKLSGVYTEAG